MRNILFIEDDKGIQQIVSMIVDSEHTTLHQAFTLEEAYEKFDEHKDVLTQIYVDGCVPGNVLNTIPLVKHMRKFFDGPIVAISSDPGYRAEMIDAGCCSEEDKTNVHQHLMSL